MIGQGLKKGTEIFMRILDAWPFLADPLMIVLRSTVYFWEEGGVEREDHSSEIRGFRST